MENKKFKLEIGGETLAKANVNPENGVTVTIENGAILITETDVLDAVPDELRELFEELGVGEDAVRAVLRENGEILEAMTARKGAM